MLIGRLLSYFIFCPLFISPLLLAAGSTPILPSKEANPEISQPKFQVGVGWPDLRVRANILKNLDGEAKVALEEGIQAYGARTYLKVASLGALGATAGLEGGYLRFDGVENLGGDGFYGQVFAGLQYTVARRWTITADFGPALIRVNAAGYSEQSQGWVYNTALYFRIF